MELKAERITAANFEEFGSILNPYDCGEPLGLENKAIRFYPDRMPLSFSGGSVISICPLILEKRPMEIDFTEIHEFCEEVIGGFTEDVIFHVGPVSEVPDFSNFRVFHLPKYHFSRLKRKVWHGGPFVINAPRTQGWVLLPPYTYTNDAKVVTLKVPIKVAP
jgi:hypothetical protein